MAWLHLRRALETALPFGHQPNVAHNVVVPTADALPLLTTFSLGLLGSVLILFWLVGLINVYNFMDGIDGLAGVQAVSAGLAWG